ncbi:hypothetical protein LUZ61_015842 [Rhynchospora tenuis]|uniref:Glucose/Sorbosone dehydrogenase domain-containing protein n=1 Tax=Rhynchospora tenuis TaxID=198213 RepID=A0AAD5Z4F2_9POAL|nr:hypothetical protein LUZ61_015842 [Rhynchospora tenuis]
MNTAWPLERNTTLAFCGYSGLTCCNATEDSAIMAKFTAMNITDSSCASTIKSILCAKCNPYSGELYTIDDTPRIAPVLCNNSTSDFCAATWNMCKNVAIPNNPFSQTSTPKKLSELYHSSSDFCQSASGPITEQAVCLNGFSAQFPPTEPTPTPEGICIERLDNMSFTNMAPHPDGSNRIFLATQSGIIFLAELQDFGHALKYNKSQPFLDLRNRVYLDYESGFMGLAFHPNFTNNGRFFVSYNCDSKKTPDCLGKCSCNSEIGCDPTNLGTDNGAAPCQYQAVIAEYTVNGTSNSPSTDHGLSTVDEVNLLTKAGNYGWRVYDGFDLFHTNWTPGGSTPPESINPIFPILVMHHSDTHSNLDEAVLVAGYVYRARTDRCLYGRFIYADLYGFDMWTANELPYMSGNFSSDRVNFTCSRQSPIPCRFVNSTTIPALGYIFSFGQDNNKDILLITYTGVYRIVRSHLCGYKCMLDSDFSSPAPTEEEPIYQQLAPTPSPVLSPSNPPSVSMQPPKGQSSPPLSSIAQPPTTGPFLLAPSPN